MISSVLLTCLFFPVDIYILSNQNQTQQIYNSIPLCGKQHNFKIYMQKSTELKKQLKEFKIEMWVFNIHSWIVDRSNRKVTSMNTEDKKKKLLMKLTHIKKSNGWGTKILKIKF